MSCDHLPFETQPESTKEGKSKQKRRHQTVSQPQELDDDSGDEYDFHYEPFQAPTSPAETNERHAEPEMEPEHRPPPVKLRVGVPVSTAPPAQTLGGEHLEEPSTSGGNLPGEQINLPAEDLSDYHSPNTSPSSSAAAETEEPIYQLPQRERHPPRRITYDQLGIPSCYSIQPPPQLFPVYPTPGLVPWLPPLQPYYFQPPCMYGLQQA